MEGAPSWRGRLHLWAFVASLPLLVALVLMAEGPTAVTAAAVFGSGLVAVFGTSATYHRLVRSPVARRVWRRLDHAMIYVLIAASYVPFCLLVLPPAWGIPLLCIVGAAGLTGVVVKLAFFERVKRWGAVLYLGMGWAAVAAMPAMVRHLEPAELALIALGGLIYTGGAVVFARQRPNPSPRTFGYHEIWHGCTVAAAACHVLAVGLILS
jgi:hemolysin III